MTKTMKVPKQLSIRPKLFLGESITSFLLRVSRAYNASIKDVWKWFAPDEVIRYARRIDLFLPETFNVGKMSVLFKKSAEQIRESTFFNLLESLQEKEDISQWGFLGDSVISKNRRFCAECIKERICYLHIWQVREIKLCDKHHVYLQDACPSCKVPIPYIHDMLSFYGATRCQDSFLV
jgi:hypothetical protein